MAALLQVQQLCPALNTTSYCFRDYLGSHWLDVTRTNHSIPCSDFSPMDYNSSYDPLEHIFADHGVIISSTLYDSRPKAKFSTPFVSGASAFEKGSGLSVDLLICDDGTDGESNEKREISFCNDVTYTTYRSWTNASHGFFETRM